MVIRNTPNNKNDFILTNNKDIGYQLQKMGYFPVYIDNEYFYFEKIKEIENIIKEGGEKIGKEN